MEVKPVGRERNIQIAELKAIKTDTHTTYKYTLDGNFPAYSTSLTDCWPLWEELPNGTELKKHSKGATILFPVNHRTDMHLGYIDYFVGTTELDAISGAWVKLKGEDNG